ncbi:MAG: cation transporter [Oscillospiraceae bacterium]|nr:cation transporter [Oscillospiraceae bacterium]
MKFTEKDVSPDIQKNENAIIKRISLVSIIGNAVLSGFKLFAGIFGRSGAMISDAVHSFSDVLTTVIAAVGVKLSKRGADKEHPYGHERLESIASLFLGILLLVTGLAIGYKGLSNIFTGNRAELDIPTPLALAAAVISIVIKEGMYRYTYYYAKLINSPAFMADAWHHRSDALSSVGSLIGIGGAMLGFPVMDPIASVVICLFVFKVSFEIGRDAVSKMLDTSRGEEYENRLREYIISLCPELRVDMLQTRTFGNMVYVDLEIALDGDMKLRDAHEIAENIHENVENSFGDIKHIMIHINPK